MSIEDAIQARLTGYAGLTAIVSTRIGVEPVSQAYAKPYVEYSLISRLEVQALGATADVIESRFQFDCVDDDFSGSVDVAEQIKAAFNRFTGTVSSIDILDTVFSNENDGYSLNDESYVRSVDIMVKHRS